MPPESSAHSAYKPVSRSWLHLLCIHFIAATIVLCGLSVSAQETTGTIFGTAADSAGAAVPGVKVSITNIDRNTLQRTLETSRLGEFTAPLLPIGRYRVEFTGKGFRTFKADNIVLNVNDKRQVNATLTVGEVSDSVTVQADALQVNTASDAASGLITGTQVRQLALQSRNYEELVQLSPGVSSDVGDALYAGVSAPNGNTNETAFSLDGSFGTANNWTIDGADNVDRGGNFSLLNYPSVDAIEEFKILRGNYGAEFGRSAGGIVNVITRSGTSKFHGGAYEFFRNDVLNANDWGNKQQSPVAGRTPFRYNDFGWTFGGPVLIPYLYNKARNRTFFFYSEELRRVVQQNPVAGTVPDANERNGIFEHDVCSTNPSDTLNCSGGTLIKAGTAVPITPAAAAYLKDVYAFLPDPTNTTNDLLFSNEANIFNFQQEIGRVDHTFGAKLSGFARVMIDSIPTQEGGGLFNGNPLPNITRTSTNSPGKNIAGSLTWTISPTLLNEAEYAWSYGAIISHNSGQMAAENSPDVVAAITLPFPQTLDRIPSIGFGANGASFYGFGTYKDYNKNNAFFDNLTKTVGRHNLKFGVSYNHYEKSENAGGNNAGTFGFQFTPYQDPNGDDQKAEFEQEFYNFLTGNSSSFTQEAADIRAIIFQNQIEFYSQDEFHFRPNLTLNFGVRYSLFRQPTDGKNHATNFVDSRFIAANAPVIDDNGNVCTPSPCTVNQKEANQNPNYDPLNGMIIADKANGHHNSPYSTAVAPQSYTGVQPRVGFSFDPFKTGLTALRGGYGIFVESPGVGFLENNEFINPPFVGNTTINNAPFAAPAGGSASNNSVQSVGGVSTNWHEPYAQEWDLDLQRQFKYDIVFDIGYYGSKGTHQLSQVDINEPRPGAYSSNQLIQSQLAAASGLSGTQQMTANSENLLNIIRPYQGYGPIDLYVPSFSSNYHSLQTSLQKRFGSASLVSVNYTWAKSLTDRPDRPGGTLAVPQDTYNLKSEYGPSRFDRRNVFNANWVYNLPFFREQHAFVGRVLGGWGLSGIVELQSGQWITAGGNSSTDPGGIGVFTSATAPNLARPDQVGNPNQHAPHTIAEWYDTSAFVNVPSDQFRPGNAARANILGPGSERWDMALLKNFHILEEHTVQFRAESFNLLNHTNYSNLDTTLDDGTTGQILGAGEKRILQLALKYNF